MLILSHFVSEVEGKEILHGINLTIHKGEIHVLMGPNGSGKSSLVMSMMGHPSYNLKQKNAKFSIDGEDMFSLSPEERAKAGLFVSFQNPVEVSGVSLLAFLRTATKSLRPDEKIPLSEFKEQLKRTLAAVSLPDDFMSRSVNEGFSGGERKRAEILQMLLLRPKIAVLDEIDSGLDVDSLKSISLMIRKVAKDQQIGILLITHYQRILHFLKPEKVHVLINGKIKKTGGMNLVRQIEKDGYAAV